MLLLHHFSSSQSRLIRDLKNKKKKETVEEKEQSNKLEFRLFFLAGGSIWCLKKASIQTPCL